MQLTVVVPTSDRSGILKRTLECFRGQDGPTDWDGLIVGDGQWTGRRRDTGVTLRGCQFAMLNWDSVWHDAKSSCN